MRRLLLVNALIFAVLAAVVAFAYFGWSNSSAVALQDEQLKLLNELANEKISNIESNVIESDNRILRAVRLDQLDKLDEQVKSSGAAVASVFVLDAELKPVLNGSVAGSRPPSAEAVAIRDWYIAHEIRNLDFLKLPLEQRRHHYGRRPGGEPYSLSYEKKQLDGKSYYVVIEDDLNHLINFMIPQFFLGSHFLYQVVDDNGVKVQGWMFKYDVDTLAAELPFVDPLVNWHLRIADQNETAANEVRRKRYVDSLLLGGAVAIILVGLILLAIAIRRERRANELKSDFISNVSHELKTPLSIISMFGEMLANGRTKSSEQATEYAEIIWRESVRLGRLIDNVLDFAKIERGMGVYEFAESDVVEVVERAIDLANRRLQAANMTLESHIDEDIPPVQLDANAFTLAVLNLVDNAIKYAAEGKKIELTLRRQDDRVVLAVRDFGPGIPLDEQSRIFERFYRAKEMRLRPIRGSGIGLALVQHIARAHGGDITVESTPGKGATFQLWLPI
ncbi:MAG TPA: HAMP domain-containing sensor histidine kinase [Kofleriaceae bacterium]|nr:HAMP domain-containing sensor histidine kinase [Kofleriaceae bacterium]